MVAMEYKSIVEISVRVLVSGYQKAAFILCNVNPFERRDKFLSQRNENRLLVPKKWLLVDSDL